MALPPQKFREIVFQLLYSQDFSPLEIDESIPFMMHELKVTKRSMTEAHARAGQVLDQLSTIDARIEKASTEYAFERISRVERTILRLGVFELLHDPSLPPKVAIAEGIRLCRKFGTPESSHFVNAILDEIYQKDRCGAKDPNTPVSV